MAYSLQIVPAICRQALIAGATTLFLNSAWSTPLPCPKPIYLTFDTGSHSQAELVAATLRKHQIKATFFLANEKTINGDYSLDFQYAPYWRSLLAEGHAFGTHTFDHVYFQADLGSQSVKVKPQFGANSGKILTWTSTQFCHELSRVQTRFKELTGKDLDPIWRAPGGRVSARTLEMASSCGFQHFGWSPRAFSGDELSSERFSNSTLLEKLKKEMRAGDIFLAHLGIWSRKDPWMPANLEPLIVDLKRRGFCFATLKEHPQFNKTFSK